MLCWLITICTIATVNRDFVIRLRNENEGVWPRPTQLWELHCAFVIRLNVVNEGGAESDRLGWHSRFANENEGRREELSLNDSVNDSPLPETRLNEQTNERLFLANWTTRTDSRKQIMKSITREGYSPRTHYSEAPVTVWNCGLINKNKTAVKASVCVQERATLLGHITLKPRWRSGSVD